MELLLTKISKLAFKNIFAILLISYLLVFVSNSVDVVLIKNFVTFTGIAVLFVLFNNLFELK